MGVKKRLYIGNLNLSIYDQSRTSVFRSGRVSRKYIIGISGSAHDAAAVLLNEKRLVSALEEERMTRTKHDGSQFPVHAILELLRANRLRWDDIDHLAVAWNYNDYIDAPQTPSYMRDFFQRLDRERASRDKIRPEQVKRRSVPERTLGRYKLKAIDSFLKRINNLTGSSHFPAVSFVHHHLAHAASAYFPSNLREPVLVIILDGYGERTTTSVWVGYKASLRHIISIHLPHSLGWAFCSITEYLGFKPLSGEGEVMGLAAYGAPRSVEENVRVKELRRVMEEFITIDQARGTFRVNEDWVYFGEFPWGSASRVTQTMINRLKPLVPRLFAPSHEIDPESPRDRGAANLAFVLQERIEQVLLQMVRHFFVQRPPTRSVQSLALAGGVALNINANGRLVQEGLISADRLFIPPAAGDAGTALGAALLVAQAVYDCDPRFHMRRADYGPEYSDAEILAALEAFSLIEGEDYNVMLDDEEIADSAANLLAKKQAIAWFQGGCEFGPRALGHRSILLNVQDPKANEIANRVKRRQFWRPSAISVIHEKAGYYIEGFESAETPFMAISFPVKKSALSMIVSGYHHVDGSTRPQTVSEQDNPRFYRLLHTLGEMTGIPAVVNSSFNRKEPLVNCPEEALNTFYYMRDLKALCMGHFLITDRKKIIPTIRSLEDEALTSDLFKLALVYNDKSIWDAVFAKTIQWLGTCARIFATLHDRKGNGIEMEWPLVKEFFSETVGHHVQDYLADAIYCRTFIDGITEILIGSTHPTYSSVVFDRLETALYSVLARQSQSNNTKNIISIRRSADYVPPSIKRISKQ